MSEEDEGVANVVRLLLDNNASPNEADDFGATPLLMAIALTGQNDVLKSLLSHPDIDVNVRVFEWYFCPRGVKLLSRKSRVNNALHQ